MIQKGEESAEAGGTMGSGASGPRLALRPRDAARALGIGERLLWTLTNQGVIPHVRLGRAVVYPVDLLREFLARQARGAVVKALDRV
jgi:hypothetical protein